MDSIMYVPRWPVTGFTGAGNRTFSGKNWISSLLIHHLEPTQWNLMSAWSHTLQKDNNLTLAKSFLPTLRCSWEKLSPLDLFTPEPAEVQVRERCVCVWGGGSLILHRGMWYFACFLLLPTGSGDAAAVREMKSIPPSVRGWREWE